MSEEKEKEQPIEVASHNAVVSVVALYGRLLSISSGREAREALRAQALASELKRAREEAAELRAALDGCNSELAVARAEYARLVVAYEEVEATNERLRADVASLQDANRDRALAGSG